MDLQDYTLEFCPWCEKRVPIRAKGVTTCHVCGHALAPCSVCYDAYGQCPANPDCPYGCECEFEDPTQAPGRPMTEDEIKFVLEHSDAY